MRGVLVAAFVSFAAVACVTNASEPLDLSGAIERIRPSVVQVAVQWRDADDHVIEPRMKQLGTGFLVHESGVFATADHVVAAAYQDAPKGAKRTRLLVAFAIPNFERRGISMTQSFTFVEVAAVARDATADVALLRTTKPFSMTANILASSNPSENITQQHSVAVLSSGPLQDGERIATSGYPLEEPVLITTSGYIAGSPIQQLEVPRGHPAWPFLSKRVVLADMQVNFSNSGGPVYRGSDGAVIGLVSGFKNTLLTDADTKPLRAGGKPIPLNSGLSVIAPTDHIIVVAREHGIDLAQPATTTR